MLNLVKSNEGKFNSSFSFSLCKPSNSSSSSFFSSFNNSFSSLSFSPALVGYTTKTPLNPNVTGFTIFDLSYF